MARVTHEYKFLRGAADTPLAGEITQLSSAGWEVAAIGGRAEDLVVLLRRETDFEVAQSLQHALEEVQTVDAVAREVPPEELL